MIVQIRYRSIILFHFYNLAYLGFALWKWYACILWQSSKTHSREIPFAYIYISIVVAWQLYKRVKCYHTYPLLYLASLFPLFPQTTPLHLLDKVYKGTLSCLPSHRVKEQPVVLSCFFGRICVLLIQTLLGHFQALLVLVELVILSALESFVAEMAEELLWCLASCLSHLSSIDEVFDRRGWWINRFLQDGSMRMNVISSHSSNFFI